VVPSSGGSTILGTLIVYVKTQLAKLPAQSVYVHVYVLSPPHTGSGPIMGPVGIIGSPQELLTAGGTGMVCASLTQATVAPSSGGKANVGGFTV
jgi:hypothetical protein